MYWFKLIMNFKAKISSKNSIYENTDNPLKVQVNSIQPTCLKSLLDPEHFTSFVQYFKAGGSSSISQAEGPSGNIFVNLSLSLMLLLHFVHVCACVWLFFFLLSSFHSQKWELACLRYFPWELCLLTNVQENTDLEYHTDRWPKKKVSTCPSSRLLPQYGSIIGVQLRNLGFYRIRCSNFPGILV